MKKRRRDEKKYKRERRDKRKVEERRNKRGKEVGLEIVRIRRKEIE